MLRTIGINSSIEFSKLSSSSEALSDIATRIVNLSREVSSVFGAVKSSMEGFEIELKQNIDKMKGFIESFSEIGKNLEEISATINTLSEERVKAESNINSAYNTISEVLSSLSHLERENEKLLETFYQFEKNFESVLEFVNSFHSIYEGIDTFIEAYKEITKLLSELSLVSEELKKI
ncbi:MAG: hypothetical protein ABDH28_00670 [Brevinematia bacterium]